MIVSLQAPYYPVLIAYDDEELYCSILPFPIEADWNQLAPLTPLRHHLGEVLADLPRTRDICVYFS
jgi:hypothetical protein